MAALISGAILSVLGLTLTFRAEPTTEITRRHESRVPVHVARLQPSTVEVRDMVRNFKPLVFRGSPSNTTPDEEEPRQYTLARPTPLTLEELEVREQEAKMLTGRWASQDHDADWSGRTAQAVATLLEESGFEQEVASEIDCRATLCRLVLQGNDDQEAVELLHVARGIHDETWLDHSETDEGSWGIEVFFSRPGYRLSGDGGRIEAS